MGLGEEDSSPEDVRCILCNIADENETTGALSSKEGTSAHQNCLIYSSGLYTKFSPSFDDLFGFDVDDVRKEYKRGRKLTCHHCGKKGATAGCEMGKCKRSFHYPCAIKDDAKIVEDQRRGIFTLYCKKHDPDRPKNPERQDSANESCCSAAGSNGIKRPRLDHSLAGNSSGSDSGTSIRIPGRKRMCESVFSDSGDSDVASLYAPVETDPEEIAPPEQHAHSTPIPEHERDKEEPTAATSGVPFPIEDGDETDLDEDAQSPSLLQSEFRHENVTFNFIVDSGPSVESENSFGPGSPSPVPAVAVASCNTSESLSPPEDAATPHTVITTAIIHPPVPSCPSPDSPPLGVVAVDEFAESPKPSSPKDPSCGDPDEHIACPASQNIHMPDMSHDLPACSTTPSETHPVERFQPPGGATVSPQPPEGREEASMSETSAARFWRRCNEVGCTGAIFTELTHQISSLAEKLQAQDATQQDYAVSLRILEASGKLPEIFRQLEQDFEERERELQRKREALRDAMTVLNHHS